MMPRFPLYIVSKGRHEFMMTSRALSAMGVPHLVVVEPQEVELYDRAIETMCLNARTLALDLSFKERYEKCDRLGLTKSTGPGPARNFAWEHSKAAGHPWHWVMDDNIKCFRRSHNNQRIKCLAPSFWRAMEDFVLRYRNVAMAGPNYTMFAFRQHMAKLPPFYLNTRIYSCNLIRNDVPQRWRGRYNEDTILSLDMLKAGWCTVQFNGLLQEKIQTQALPGGNTAEFYHAEGKLEGKASYATGGTDAKSEMLARVHPDVSRVVWKFGRVHHQVNYNQWKKRKLLRRPGVAEQVSDAEYGMALVTQGSDE